MALPPTKRKLEDVIQKARDALTCGVCLELIVPPVQQCSEGHPICDECMSKLPSGRSRARTCPTCRTPFPGKRLRNLLADELAELLEYPCPYKNNGCSVTMSPKALKEHSESCLCNPALMRCPVQNCSWRGRLSEFWTHMQTKTKPSSESTISEWLNHSNAMNESDQTRTQRVVTNEDWIWLDGQNPNDLDVSWISQSPQVLAFEDAVFCTYARRVKQKVMIGIFWASAKISSPRFTYTVSVLDRSGLGGLQRWGSAETLPTSADAMTQGNEGLSLDSDTLRCFMFKQKNLRGNLQDGLKVKIQICKAD
eukprot:TRINITY_DN66456_c0_g1_i1.p1 TRINITY_DN66456_c0_g1~~TRINITY_DN66456_c0_g1_i1.p1  ORF type:complete len:309 (-),score=18.09 TRINITY_DN66456_c0_g1_i1:209-1135(-)